MPGIDFQSRAEKEEKKQGIFFSVGYKSCGVDLSQPGYVFGPESRSHEHTHLGDNMGKIFNEVGKSGVRSNLDPGDNPQNCMNRGAQLNLTSFPIDKKSCSTRETDEDNPETEATSYSLENSE